MSKSSPLHTLGEGQVTGFSAETCSWPKTQKPRSATSSPSGKPVSGHWRGSAMGWNYAGVLSVREASCIDSSETVRSTLRTLKGHSTRDVRTGRLETNVSDAGSIHPKNAAGPFDVLNGCCTACGVPTATAPNRSNSTRLMMTSMIANLNAEMAKALQVLRSQELGCVRYRGTDEAILRRLAEAGEAQQCDHAPAGVGVVLRNVVTFAISDSNHMRCLWFPQRVLRLLGGPISPPRGAHETH